MVEKYISPIKPKSTERVGEFRERQKLKAAEFAATLPAPIEAQPLTISQETPALLQNVRFGDAKEPRPPSWFLIAVTFITAVALATVSKK